jgi:hypothetical protein
MPEKKAPEEAFFNLLGRYLPVDIPLLQYTEQVIHRPIKNQSSRET